MPERIWTQWYDEGVPAAITVEHVTLLDYFCDNAATRPESPFLHYRDKSYSWREGDSLSSQFAQGLAAAGVVPGDRVLVSLQNVPEFVLAVLGIWKAGCIVVPTNPMYRERELLHLLADSGSVAAVLSMESPEQLNVAIAHEALRLIITVELSDQPKTTKLSSDRRMVSPNRSSLTTRSFDRFCADSLDQSVDITHPISRADVAMIAYTSGTTGVQKGAMNTHGNVAFASQVYRDFLGLVADDCIMAVAPLSHMTGLVGHIGISIATGAPLVLTYRFNPKECLGLLEKYRCTFMVGPITAYQGLMDVLPERGTKLASLTRAYSGGAPVSPALVDRFERLTGCYIHNCFGMTETTAPAVLTPVRQRAPVDPSTGALSIGVPVPNTLVTVHDDAGEAVEAGELGELYFDGPQVVAGYWENPQASGEALTASGALKSGDIGFIDADGWVYLVDRKKDQINTSGFKVWPREVEDIIYQVPDVDEVVVIGMPDNYRGEAVAAFVKMRGDQDPIRVENEIQRLCRAELAPYKCPRSVTLVDELPKTPTGKLSRNSVRESQTSPQR